MWVKIIMTILTIGLNRLNWFGIIVSIFSNPVAKIKGFLMIVGLGTCIYWGVQLHNSYGWFKFPEAAKQIEVDAKTKTTRYVYPWDLDWWTFGRNN